MQLKSTLYIAPLLFCIFLNFVRSEEKFYEELLIRRLPDGKFMTHFQFTTHWDVDRSDVDACKCQFQGYIYLIKCVDIAYVF